MGLMDVLNGMNNGPRGQLGSTGASGGMSPITMGLLALLAYKAFKGSSILGPATSGAQQPSASRPDTPTSGGVGDWLSELSTLIAGGGAGTILTGGLGELVKKFQQSGQGPIAQSWVGTGQNVQVAPSDLEKAVGLDTLDALSQQTGVTREQLLAELTKQLPKTVDALTPDGRIPDEHEVSRWV